MSYNKNSGIFFTKILVIQKSRQIVWLRKGNFSALESLAITVVTSHICYIVGRIFFQNIACNNYHGNWLKFQNFLLKKFHKKKINKWVAKNYFIKIFYTFLHRGWSLRFKNIESNTLSVYCFDIFSAVWAFSWCLCTAPSAEIVEDSDKSSYRIAYRR